ncbi:MAG: M20 family metallopeptidase [Coriobacteriia bacterium]|nr:M20 family metallopeptidase [Coriobacteriia bacterium]
MVDEEFAWRLAAELVRIESTDPGCYEGNIERHLKSLVEAKLGELPSRLADAVEIRELEVLPGRRNLMVRVPGTGPEPALVYSCHMDTVTIGDGWDPETPALAGRVIGDKLYGRGACDMKSGLACAVAALFSLLDRAAAAGALPRRAFALLLSVDEEDFMRGIEAAIAAGWVGAGEWIVDTEPTDGQVQVAHKGRTWFEISMRGETAHASQPWKGADAVAAMAEVVCELRRWCEALPAHNELGHSTITFGQIEGGYRPYVVPDACKLWVDMRLVPPASTAAARAAVEAAVRTAEERVPGARGSYEVTGDRPPIERDPASPAVAALLAAAAAEGHPAEVGTFTGYTDTAVVAGTCGNRNCMSYGPGSLALAHKPNEHVPLADVMRVQKVLARLAADVCL